jgi:hypothetical protein
LRNESAGTTPGSIVVTLEFASEQVAFRFERYLKSGSGWAFAKRLFSSTWRPVATSTHRNGNLRDPDDTIKTRAQWRLTPETRLQFG